MGRWSHLDSDEERLPEGMARIGYDADTQIYTYRDSDGSLWEGAPGCQYGTLHRVRCTAPPLPSVEIADDVEGDEKPYVLHDYDSSDFDDDDNHTINPDDEKAIPLASPHKAKLHTGTTTNPHHPALGKALPDLPGTDEADKLSMLSGTTVHEMSLPPRDHGSPSPRSENQDSNTATLKRAGTLSRIARFLTSSSSDAGAAQNLSRRATVNGRAPAARSKHVVAGGDAGNRWPGSGTGQGVRAPRKRATTFDEILGVDGGVGK